MALSWRYRSLNILVVDDNHSFYYSLLVFQVGKLEVTMVELQDVVLSQKRFMMLLLVLVLVLQVAILVHMWGTSSGSEAAPPIAMEAPAEPPSGSLPPADLPLAPHVHGQSGDL